MKTLIMHGSYGSPNENWFRWLEAELISLGHQVILEQFPVDDWNTVEKIGMDKRGDYQPIQSLESWTKYFEEHILPQIEGEEFNVVGHSMAPQFVLFMLEKYNLKINAAIFIAPFLDLSLDNKDLWMFHLTNQSFYKTDFDFETIKSKIKQSYVVYGDNDPYVPAEKPKEFAEKLDSSIVPVHNGGHCGGAFKKFPLILELLKVSM